MKDTRAIRAAMVDEQIRRRGIRDERLLEAMREVPREAFLPRHLRAFAYDDGPLPIGAGQTISQPYIVACMIDAAAIGPDDRVLEVGLGSGYAAAVMSRMARRVYAIERHEELTASARERLATLGFDNVEVMSGDGTAGWPEHAPFDATLVAAGAPEVPAPLRDQLAVGGRLVMPVGSADMQRLVRLTRTAPDDFAREELEPVRFVPLIGAHGWAGDEPGKPGDGGFP